MYDITVDRERRRVVTTWGSLVTDASLLSYQKAVWDDQGVHGFDWLIDFSGLQEIEVTTEGLEAVAHMAAGMDGAAGRSRFAIVVGDSLAYGLSRMYEAFREMDEKSTRQVMVFKRRAEALAWLDKGATA